jgi:hypothetical protein
MRTLKGWDAYVAEATSADERSIELPLTDDESYIIQYPTRRQGKAIAEAQASGDVDALLIALLGKEAGRRVAELSEDSPGFVLDEFLLDVMRGFGFVPDDLDAIEAPKVVDAGKSSGASPRRTTTRKRGAARGTSSAA